MDQGFDQKIREALEKHTRLDSADLQQVWSALEREISVEKKPTKGGGRGMRRGWIWLTSAAAAAVLMVFALQTPSGEALVNQIRNMFAEEKQVVQEIEGDAEETQMNLKEGTGADYVIYIDEERYVLERTGEGDRIVPREPLGDAYPEVSMTIRQEKELSPEEALAKVQRENGEQYQWRDITPVAEPVQGWVLHGISGHSWDSKVLRAYAVDNGQGGSFVIEQRYFLEAAEGHGARMDHMLREFQIVEKNE